MPNHPEPELRIALAMRGGVSLAVWMGGACAELDALRRSTAEDADGVYVEILEAAGYGSVAVDVIAGASAGGLNGVLMGCSVVHGMRFDSQIRKLWLQLGDLAKLSRPIGHRATLSPLDGDGEFFAPLAEKLDAAGGGSLAGPLRNVGSLLVGVEIGGLVGWLGQRVLGQYELSLLQPEVPPRIVPDFEGAIQDVRDLDVDEELASIRDDFADNADEQVAIIKEAQTVAESGDKKAYHKKINEIETLDSESNELANQLGADGCLDD